MSQGKRYKFQGSTFSVQTAVGAGKSVNAVTKANPAVVSSPNHGLANGDIVKLVVPHGMTELDGQLAIVNNKATSTFELEGVDSSGYTTFVAESPTVAFAEKATMSAFCELTGVNQQGGAAAQIDVTTICSTAKEFELGLSDSGTLALDFNWAGNQAVQAALRAANVAKTLTAFRIDFPNSGGSVIMFGFVLSTSFQGAVDGTWKASASVKLSGDITVLS